MKALHGSFFQGAVEALRLPVGPGVGRLREAVLVAHAVENRPPDIPLVGHIELRPVVGQYFMHFVRSSRLDPAQEIGGQHFGRSGLQLGEGRLASAVDGHQ